MAPPRTWLPRAQEILKILRESTAESLDRPAIESLFEIQRRMALLLMKAVGPYVSPNRFMVERTKLIRWVERIWENESQDLERRRRVAADIDQSVARNQAVRKALEEQGRSPVQFPVVQEVLGASVEELPPAIQIEPGQVTIRFPSNDPIEACQLFHMLAIALANDFFGFEARLHANQHASQHSCKQDCMQEQIPAEP